jgi:hypothetical protein
VSTSKPPAKTETGEGPGLKEAIQNAFDKLGRDYTEAKLGEIHVSADHSSPSHITQWKVEVRG